MIALIYAMALGADSIDDTELLRAGRTRRLLGGWLPGPSTLGTFLRAFTVGHGRRLDRLPGEALARAWRAGAGPGAGRLVVDVDSFVGHVHGYLKQGAAFGYTRQRGYHPLLAWRADTGEVLHVRLRKGSANTQRGILRFTEELIARVERAGASGAKLLRADSGFWNAKVFVRLDSDSCREGGPRLALGRGDDGGALGEGAPEGGIRLFPLAGQASGLGREPVMISTPWKASRLRSAVEPQWWAGTCLCPGTIVASAEVPPPPCRSPSIAA